jgi:glycosyltransferase involved in cell wall biosynthesis
MEPRAEQGDFLCLIGGGILFEPLITAMQDRMIAVEYAIGYAGVASRTWHAYGSSNWQHVVWGLNMPQDQRGRFYDRWIPHYFDPNDFEYNAHKDDYLLYLGKIKEDKGVNVAARAAEAAGRRLIVAGQGPTPVEYGEVRNRYIDSEERRELLAGASAVFVPSLYVEPFGMIAVEALLSGTPIITTPWGGLGEINLDGVTGYQCNTMQDFVDAARKIDNIHPEACWNRGMRYDMDNVRHEYQRWFDDLYGLWGNGWGEVA